MPPAPGCSGDERMRRSMSFLDSRQQVAPRGIGKPVLRREDARFVTGTGRYADDVNLPGQTYAYVVRSPHAHARIAKIDVGPPAAAGNQWLEPRRKCLMKSSSSGPFHCSSQERSHWTQVFDRFSPPFLRLI